MNTSEVLNRAADLIEERGWTKGTGGWPGHRNHCGPLCLEGGLLATLGVDWSDPSAVCDAQYTHAWKAMADYVGRTPLFLFMWNDVQGRTQAEVIEVLRAAALIEQAKEHTPADAEAAGVSA
jgi:hypothetical protein